VIIIDPANINGLLPPSPAPTSGLNFGGQRGAPQNRLVLSRDADFVRLQLTLKAADAYESYSATLETVEGSEVWRRGALRASAGAFGAKRLSLTVPANVLRTAGYILKLSGRASPTESENTESENVAEYYFSVVKR
jgi:hypothetical protein